METVNFTLWYIRKPEDPTFHTIPFKSEAEAVRAIEETEDFWDSECEPYSVVFPVTFDPKDMDRRARTWVQEQYENVSIDWSTADYWQFIETEHHGGRGAFMIMSLLDQPFTR